MELIFAEESEKVGNQVNQNSGFREFHGEKRGKDFFLFNNEHVGFNSSTFFQSKSVAGKKPSKSAGKNSVKSPEPHQEAMEAWKRRKNYNPMMAAGIKHFFYKETVKSGVTIGGADSLSGFLSGEICFNKALSLS